MRTAILLMCCIFLLLTGCPAGDPAHPGGGSGIDGSLFLTDGAIDEGDEPLVEMFDLPPDYVDPPFERTGAGVTEGSVILAGSVELTGAPSPQTYSPTALNKDVMLIHLKAQASGGAAEQVTVEVEVPGFTSTYQFPADGAWHYRAIHISANATCTFRLHNRPDVTGDLNPGAAIVEYYFRNQNRDGAHEVDDDENPASITDYTLSTPINTGDEANQSVYRLPGAPGLQDLEDWYYLAHDSGSTPCDRLLTFSTYGQRYTPTSYRITFFARIQPYPGFAATVLKRAGLPFILTEKTMGKVFKLSHLYREGYYVQIVAMPQAPLPGSNFQFQLHAMAPSHPLGINYITGEDSQIGVANEVTSTTLRVVGYFPGTGVTRTWDFGGGATCESSCTSANPRLTLGAAGTYTGSVRVDWSGGSATREFQYRVGAIDPDWRFETQPIPGSYKTPVIIPDVGFSHLVYLNTTAKQLHHSRLTSDGFEDTTILLRGNIKMARRSGLIHRGRLVIAYVDADSHYLFVLMSNDTSPQGETDWIQYALAEGASTTFPVQLATMGEQLVLTYGTSDPVTTAIIAQAVIPEPLSAADWSQSPLVGSTALEQATIAAHNGRWWAATMTDAGLLRLGYARTPAPQIENDWVWMDLATLGQPGDKREATPRLLSVNGRLIVGYSRPDTYEITSRIGISDHSTPFNAGHFRWTKVDQPFLDMGVPGIAISSDGTHLFGFTADVSSNDGFLSWGELPPSGQSLSLVTIRAIENNAGATYSIPELVYEPATNVLLVVWTYSTGEFKIERITL